VATHFHNIRIKDIRNETLDCVSIAFELPPELKEIFRFTQGQNITIRFNSEGEEIRRSYSICTSPLENELRIAVKKVEGGKFSAFSSSLKKNDTLSILPPTGTFFTKLDPAHQANYVAFAAGSGITPVISIIKTTLSTEPMSSFALIYGNRNRSSIIFREELEAIKNKYMDRFSMHHILSREQTDADINHGRIDAEKCESLSKLIDIHDLNEFFICGPEQMIFTVKDWLEEKGVNKGKIHFELFTVPGHATTGTSTVRPSSESSDAKISQVTIRQDGISFSFDLKYDDDSILDAALSEGVDLPFACKGGVCSTCRAMLVEGKVEMENNYALEPEELNRGFILTCQSHPRSGKVVIDFDLK